MENKVTFEDFRVMMREYEQLNDKVPIYFFEARNALKEAKDILKEYKGRNHEVPRSINAHFKWFVEYRQKARDGRNKMSQIEALVREGMEFKLKQDVHECQDGCADHGEHEEKSEGSSCGNDCGGCSSPCDESSGCEKEVCDGECEQCEND